MKKLSVLLLFVCQLVWGQTKISDGVLKGSVTGTEKIPVSGSGHPVINSNLIYTYMKARADSVYVKIATPKLTNSSTLGYVWTATGTTGLGSWQAASGGGGTVATLAQMLAGTNNTAFASPLRVRNVTPKVFNVEAYGAVHDGVFDANGAMTGTDDTPAIRLAVAAAKAAGGYCKIILPYGNYYIHSSLITSQDGINPNAQIVIPLTDATQSGSDAPFLRIEFEGESVGSLADGMIGLRYRNTVGVILYSDITGTGTMPSVIGNSYADFGWFMNQTEVSFKNIEVRVKSMSGASHQAATMSAFNLRYSSSCEVRNCIASIQSPTYSSATQASAGTVGFHFPLINNSGNILAENLQSAGFEIGYSVSEHFEGNQIWATGCAKGLQFNSANHIIHLNKYFANGCKYAIYYAGAAKVLIDEFGFERASNSKWYDGTYDVAGSAQAGQGVINYYGFVQGDANPQTATFDNNTQNSPLILKNLDQRQNVMGGGGFMAATVGARSYPDSPWLELYSGDSNFSVVNLGTNNATADTGLGLLIFQNFAATGGDKRMATIRVKNGADANSGVLETYVRTSGTHTLTMSNTGADITFSVPIKLTNTVSTLNPTSPNRTITVVVNGVTLYIPAKTTND